MKSITVVVAVYNVEHYLDKCLSSLALQDCTDYQVLCVNDGSTDGSREIIQKYVDEYANFAVLDKENGGLSDARNFGLRVCETPYISFIDGDDFVEADYISRCLKEMKEKDLDLLVFGYNQYYLSDGHFEKCGLRIESGVYSLSEHKELLAYTPNAAWNKVYRTVLFRDYGIEYPFGYRHQDLGTTPKLLLRAKRVGYIHDCLYNYLIDRPNNITAQIDRKLYHIVDMSKEVMNYYKSQGVFEEYREEFAYLIRRNFIQSLRKAMKLKDILFVFGFIDDVFNTADSYLSGCKGLYPVAEESGDSVYLSRFKCKLYYLYKRFLGR